jgi:hypothetical protein
LLSSADSKLAIDRHSVVVARFAEQSNPSRVRNALQIFSRHDEVVKLVPEVVARVLPCLIRMLLEVRCWQTKLVDSKESA